MILDKKKSIILIAIFFLVACFLSSNNFELVFADELSDNIYEQIGNLNLSELEEFFNSIVSGVEDFDFLSCLNGLLSGNYTLDFSSVFKYILNVLFSKVFELLPILVGVIAISILCGIVQNSKGSFLSDSVAEITFFVCMLSIVLILTAEILSVWKNVEITIENIAKLVEIMSPIIVTLMIAVGGNVSASVYRPTVAFLSGSVINVVMKIVMPMVVMITVFNIASNFSSTIKLNKFVEFATAVIKWTLGIVVTVFSVFITVQGITSAHYDGISVKAAKYAISNSIPLIGGFLKDGFDLVVAGSVLIKNAIGVCAIFILFYLILSPVIYLAIFSLLLKLVGAIVEPVCDARIAGFCTSISKTASYLTVTLLTVGFMSFISVVLVIISANAFI